MTKVIRFYLSTQDRHVPAMVKPPTSCTAGGHSCKELFEKLYCYIRYLYNTDYQLPSEKYRELRDSSCLSACQTQTML
jgi:hypothetical protein